MRLHRACVCVCVYETESCHRWNNYSRIMDEHDGSIASNIRNVVFYNPPRAAIPVGFRKFRGK